MKNDKIKLVLTILLFVIILLLSSCAAEIKKAESTLQDKDRYKDLTPEKVVKEYYTAWATFDFKKQYALISDGFKKLEPSAKDLETFSNYMLAFYGQGSAIELLEVSQKYFDGKEAEVGFRLNLKLKSGQEEIKSGVQKLRLTDSGWKLVAPYGNKIDDGLNYSI